MLVNSSCFRALMDVCIPKTDVLSVKVENERMKVCAIDPSRVSMVKGSIAVEDASDVEFSIGMNKLNKLIPKRNEKMEINIGDATVEFEIGKKKVRVRKIGVDYSELKVPELNFSANVVVSADDFVEVMNDAGLVSEEIIFEVRNGEGIIKGKDSMIDYEYVAFGKGDGIGRYGYLYVKEIVDIVSKYFKDRVVEIAIGKNLPLKVEVKNDDMEFMWLIAPRIMEE